MEDTTTNEPICKMRQPVCHHCAVWLGGKIFIFGGTTTGEHEDNTDTIQVFDPLHDTCVELEKRLPNCVSQMAATVYKDNVVILGGIDNEGEVLNTAIKYQVVKTNDTLTVYFNRLPDMPTGRYDCTAVTIYDYIIVMGGCIEPAITSGGRFETKSVEYYNFYDGWTKSKEKFPDMTQARAGATAVRCNIPVESMIHS